MAWNSTRPRMRNAWRPDYARLPIGCGAVVERHACRIDLNGSATARDALKTLADSDTHIASFMHLQPSLRDIFVRYAGNGAAHRETAHD